MKQSLKWFLGLGIAVLIGGSVVMWVQTESKPLSVMTVQIVAGLDCDSCDEKLTQGVKAIKGVKAADIKNNMLTVSYMPKKVGGSKILAEIGSLGYRANQITSDAEQLNLINYNVRLK